MGKRKVKGTMDLDNCSYKRTEAICGLLPRYRLRKVGRSHRTERDNVTGKQDTILRISQAPLRPSKD